MDDLQYKGRIFKSFVMYLKRGKIILYNIIYIYIYIYIYIIETSKRFLNWALSIRLVSRLGRQWGIFSVMLL